MTQTKIEWADAVWNPVVGCSKVSAGCKNCYAERMAARLKAMGRPEYKDVVTDDGRWNGHVTCLPERLDDPLHWKKPRRVFLNSMSDLFHEDVPAEFIREVFRMMARCHWHTFIILTKREKRMANLVDILSGDGLGVLPNVWLGVSVEDQKSANERIPWLLKTPAAVRVVSVEPMLGQVDLAQSIFNPEVSPIRFPQAVLASNLVSSLGWVICGGESGPGARPIHPDWVRSLRDQCQAASVPFFFKQWGEWYSFNNPPIETKPTRITSIGNTFESEEWFGRVGKKAAGRELDGQVWDQYPEAANG